MFMPFYAVALHQAAAAHANSKLLEKSLLFRLSLMRQKRGSIIMTDLSAPLYDEETLNFDVPDTALELAGSKLWEGPASSFTVSFCSGIDTCPSYPQ
jgi:hypothetical protein